MHYAKPLRKIGGTCSTSWDASLLHCVVYLVTLRNADSALHGAHATHRARAPLDPTKYYYTAVTLLRRVHEAIVDLAHGVWGAHAVLVVRNGVDLKAGVLGIPR